MKRLIATEHGAYEFKRVMGGYTTAGRKYLETEIGLVNVLTESHERAFSGLAGDFGPYETAKAPWNVGPFESYYGRIVRARIACMKTAQFNSPHEIY